MAAKLATSPAVFSVYVSFPDRSYKCLLCCQQAICNETQLKSHLSSDSHKIVIEKSHALLHRLSVNAPPAKSKTKVLSDGDVIVPLPGCSGFHCILCGMCLSGYDPLGQHLKGKNHKKQILLYTNLVKTLPVNAVCVTLSNGNDHQLVPKERRDSQVSQSSQTSEHQMIIEAEERLAKATIAAEKRIAQAALDAEHRVTLAALNAGRIAQQVALLANHQNVEQTNEEMKSMEGKVMRQKKSHHKFCDSIYMVLRGKLLSFYKNQETALVSPRSFYQNEEPLDVSCASVQVAGDCVFCLKLPGGVEYLFWVENNEELYGWISQLQPIREVLFSATDWPKLA